MIRLHTHPLSTFSRRVHVALIEKNIPFEAVVVDMAARKHRAPGHLALNPYGRVPVLEEDGFVLYESAAILQYLEATHPQPPLVPEDARGRALVDMHLRLCDLQMARATGTILFPRRFLPKERWDETAMAAAQQEIAAHLRIVAAQLGARDYLVGESYGLADITYLPFLEFLPMLAPPDAIPDAIKAWRERLLSRPSSVRTRPEK